MFRSQISRLAAVGALVLSALAMGVAPAGAGSISPAGGAGFVDNGDGTVNVIYDGFTSPYLYLYPENTTCPSPAGGIPSTPLALIGGNYALAASPATIGVTTNVYIFASPAVAPGSPLPAGMYSWCLYDMASPGSYYLSAEGGNIPVYSPVSGSMVDNGNGSLTLTYANTNNDYSQELFFFVTAAGTTCPADINEAITLTNFFALSSQASFALLLPLATSPVVVGPGTTMVTFTSIAEPPSTGILSLTSFQACLYLSGNIEGDTTPILAQSLAIAPPLPTPVPEPIAPAFTG